MHIRFTCLAAIAVFVPAALLADTIPACPAGTLVPYLQNACQNNFGAVFSAFTFSSSQSGMAVLDPSLITVTPFQSGSSFGLQFNLDGLMAQKGLGIPWLSFTVTSPAQILSAAVTTQEGVASADTRVSFCDADGDPCDGDDEGMVTALKGQTASVDLPFLKNAAEVKALLNPGRDEMFSISFQTASTDPGPSAVPEPLTMALAGGGLIALGLMARRRRPKI